MVIAEHMDFLTDKAVAVSTIPFLLLMVPQIITNFQDPDKAGTLKWAGIASGGIGNLLLASFFMSANEKKQALIQAIGAFTNTVVVVQVFMCKDEYGNRSVPTVPFFIILIVMIIGLILPGLRAVTDRSKRLFEGWLKLTTVVGMSALCFSLATQCVDTFSVKEGALTIQSISAGVGLLVGVVLLVTGKGGGTVGGSLATALFMFLPVPQLIGNLVDPTEALDGFNVVFIYLNTLGNGLGMSRAIYTRNYVWMAGAVWGCYVGGVLLSITCVIGNRQLAKRKMSPAQEIMLLIFQGLFILYTLAVLYFDRQAKYWEAHSNASFEMDDDNIVVEMDGNAINEAHLMENGDILTVQAQPSEE